MEVKNVNRLEKDNIWRDALGLTTQMLGGAAGSRRLYVNMDTVPPGSYSTKYHSHTSQEEFFLVLAGTGTLRLDGKTGPVSKGDFFAKPAGQGIAHAFYNSGTEPLVILDVGTVEGEDTCIYPDEKVLLHKCGAFSEAYREADRLTDWTSEPNPAGEKD